MKQSNLRYNQVILRMILFVVLFHTFNNTSYGYDKKLNKDKDALALANMLENNNPDFKSMPGLNMIKPEDLGLKVKYGQIDYKSMTKAQQDTIVIAMFNPEDNYLDIAVFYKSRNVIVIYLNQANGYLAEYNHISYKSENAERIEAFIDKKPGELVPPFVKCSLKVIFNDKSMRTISNRMINKQNMLEDGCDNTFFRTFDFPRNMVFTLDFIQIWSHSENTHNAMGYNSAVDDIDNDGKTEIVYTYYLNSLPPYPAKIVVFKSLGNSQFVVEWDSVFTNGAFVMNNQTIDFDNNGFKEVFLAAYFPWTTRVSAGFLEKNVYGYYRYYYTGLDYMGYTFQSIELRDTMRIDNIKNKGLWICGSVSDPQSSEQTEIHRSVYNGHRDNIGFGFNDDGNIIFLEPVTYDMKVFDMDGDGKEELLLGDVQFGTSYFGYLDSTGVGTNHGYEYKYVLPNEPLAAGYIFQKDYDNDGVKEFYLAGPGVGTGCIGVVKHTGAPGTNNFSVMWWDSTGIMGAPINGMDSGYVDGKYSFVHPAIRSMPGYFQRRHLYVFTRDGMYNFSKSYYQYKDSLPMIQPHLTDLEHTGKAYIVAPQSYGYNGHFDNQIAVYKQLGSIGINNNNTEVPDNYRLYQNYPNPFNPVTKIKFSVPESGKWKTGKGVVILKVFDILGREIATLVNEKLQSGTYEATFNGSQYPSGVYFYRLTAEVYTETKKMLLVR